MKTLSEFFTAAQKNKQTNKQQFSKFEKCRLILYTNMYFIYSKYRDLYGKKKCFSQ